MCRRLSSLSAAAEAGTFTSALSRVVRGPSQTCLNRAIVEPPQTDALAAPKGPKIPAIGAARSSRNEAAPPSQAPRNRPGHRLASRPQAHRPVSAVAGAYLDFATCDSITLHQRTATTQVYFFYQDDCPTCQATDAALRDHGVPDGFTVFEVDLPRIWPVRARTTSDERLPVPTQRPARRGEDRLAAARPRPCDEVAPKAKKPR